MADFSIKTPQFVKGLARGLTADIVGGPVDLATILLNSGLAGYGYLGNKLGVLKPNEMPDLIEKPIGGSDWFAGKNTPLTDDGSLGFTAGRVSSMLAPLAPKALAKIPAPKQGQTNSLLGGLAGKDDPNLWLSHGGDSHELIRPDGNLIRELYNPSFAITRDKLSTFKGANSVIVPYPEKLDPKNAKTLLTATDSYNPRWHASKAARIDNLPWNLDLQKGLADQYVSDFVNQRLFEKLGNPYPKQGIKQEGQGDAPKGRLPKLMQGMAGVTDRYNPVNSTNEWFSHRILMSPRFQSLESFAQSPYGGKLVGDISGQERLNAVKSSADALLNRLRVIGKDGQPATIKGWESSYRSRSTPNLIKGLASNTHPAELLSRQKDPSLTFLDELIILDETAPDGYRSLTKAEQREVQQHAGKLLTKAKTAPSDYAELKAYGPWQVSADNVAGIVGRPAADWKALEAATKKRGIGFEPTDNAADEVEAAKYLLTRKKDTPPLMRGLASRPEKIAPTQKPLFTDVESAMHFQKLSENDLKAFDLLDLFDKYDYKSVLKKYDEALDFAKGDSLMGTNSPGAKLFFQTASLDKPTELATKNVENMLENMSLSKAEAGEWDYIPDSLFPLLEQYASGGGYSALKSALAEYKHKSLTGTDADHEIALKNVLMEWDAAKPSTSNVTDVQKQSAMMSFDEFAADAFGAKTAAPKLPPIEEMTFDQFKQVDPGKLDKDGLISYLKAGEAFKKWNFFDSHELADEVLSIAGKLLGDKVTAKNSPSLATGLAASPKPTKDWSKASWTELTSALTSDMPPDEWNSWKAASDKAKDNLISSDWSGMGLDYLQKLKSSPQWHFLPTGAKLKINDAISAALK